METTAAVNWKAEPFYRVEAASLADPRAAEELSRRYVADKYPTRSPRRQAQLMVWFLRGFNDLTNYLAGRRASSFQRPLTVAYEDGKRKRTQLIGLLTFTHAGVTFKPFPASGCFYGLEGAALVCVPMDRDGSPDGGAADPNVCEVEANMDEAAVAAVNAEFGTRFTVADFEGRVL